MGGDKQVALHRPVGVEKMVSAFFKIARSCSARARAVRNWWFSRASSLLPAAWVRAARTQAAGTATLNPKRLFKLADLG